MTDISNWRDHVEAKDNYMMVPLTEYQMGNLLDVLSRAHENGDWYGELQDIIGAAMKKGNIAVLWSNNGLKFTQEQVLARDIRSSHTK